MLCVGTAAQSRANHIDFIVDGSFSPLVAVGSGSASDVQVGDGGNILGTEREITIDFGSGGSGVLVAAGPGLAAGAGAVGANTALELLFSNSAGSAGTMSLMYDGVGSAGLGGLDFDTAWDAITVGVSDIQGAGNLSVTVADTNANIGTLTTLISAANNYNFQFTDAAFAGVDFSLVDSVEVSFVTTIAGSDVNFSQITREVVIPEPTAVALGALGLIGLAIGRRRS
jgi:hypothetical protein